MFGVEKYKFNDFEDLQIKINNLKNNGENCYAIVVEPLSASTLRLTTNEFLVKARKLCDEENILLIYDEIYSG